MLLTIGPAMTKHTPDEFWIDFRDNGDPEVVHTEPPTHVQGECVHVIEATPASLAAEELLEALKNFVNRKRPPHWTEILEIQAEFKELIAKAEGGGE